MGVRILHCGTNISNYNLCVENQVAGFPKKAPMPNDIVYLVIKINNINLCGARGVLGNFTSEKPWEDSHRYNRCLSIVNLEFCHPFDIKLFSEIYGHTWAFHVIVGNKILIPPAVKKITNIFNKNISDLFYDFKLKKYRKIKLKSIGQNSDTAEPIQIDFGSDDSDFYRRYYKKNKNYCIFISNKVLSDEINIRRNYQIINHLKLDAILIVFNIKSKYHFDIFLIINEEESSKYLKSEIDKSKFFKDIILPNVTKTASDFSLVNDRQLRENIINELIEKIIDSVFSDSVSLEKLMRWITQIDSNISKDKISFKAGNIFHNAFLNNLKILLIYNYLSKEQSKILSDVLKSFKLDNNKSLELYTNL